MSKKTLSIVDLTKISDEDTKFDSLRIEQSIMQNSNNTSKWLGIGAIEGARQRGLVIELERLYSARYKHYRWDSEYECSRGEIETMVKGEEEYINLLKVVELSKEKLNLIEGTIKALNTLSYNLGHYVKWEQLKSG